MDSDPIRQIVPMHVLEKEAMAEALAITGNIKEAAKALQINWRTMYRRVEEYGIPYEKKNTGRPSPRPKPGRFKLHLVSRKKNEPKEGRKARANVHYFRGRKSDYVWALNLLREGVSTREIAGLTGLARNTVMRIKRLDAGANQ